MRVNLVLTQEKPTKPALLYPISRVL